MIKKLVERSLIKIINILKIDLLPHAHVQKGVGHNTYVSGEEHIINKVIFDVLKREPGIIFDIGANNGEYANQLRRRFKTSAIHCFEPVPKNYADLLTNVKNSNIICHNIAMGKEDGVLKLFKASGDGDGSMVTAYQGTIKNVFTFVGEVNETMECPITTIDNFCVDTIDKIDFLKIDVEGHELEVLKGAPRMIGENRINIIQFEFNEFNIFSKSFLWDFYEILPGYDFYRILPKNKLLPLKAYNSVNEIFRYQNILAVNKTLNYTYAE
jgi:FkbM family methyltransferase